MEHIINGSSGNWKATLKMVKIGTDAKLHEHTNQAIAKQGSIPYQTTNSEATRRKCMQVVQ
jgi:hypothetical protein